MLPGFELTFPYSQHRLTRRMDKLSEHRVSPGQFVSTNVQRTTAKAACSKVQVRVCQPVQQLDNGTSYLDAL